MYLFCPSCHSTNLKKDSHTYFGKQNHQGQRVGRLVRKSLSFSKLDKWHDLAIGWFFWEFNLERQHFI